MKATNAIEFHSQIATEFTNKYWNSEAFRERYQVWTSLFDRYVVPGSRVLDLGCGPGVFCHYLAGKGCTVTGVDGSAAMLALCRARTSSSVNYWQATLPLVNPLGFGLHDVVLLSSVLEYLAEPLAMVRQVDELLRPNGLLLVSIPNQNSIYRMVERSIFWLTKRPAYFTYSQRSITLLALTRHLVEMGFKVVETIYHSGDDPVSKALKSFCTESYVNNLVVGVYQKQA